MVFFWGGYTDAMPLVIEYARKEKRGCVGGFIIAGFPAAYVSINLITMLMFAFFPLGGLNSPYVQWGWQIQFIIGALLAEVLALYYVYKVSESEVWQAKVTSLWRVIVIYINGRFVTDVRAPGFGIGFSLSVILPSFYAFYMDWLSTVMPFSLTAVVLLVLGGLIGTYGAFKGPETKNVNLTTY